MKNSINYRPATKEDVLEIATYLDIAMEGIFQVYFNGIVPDVDYFQLMSGWLSDDSQYYSYPNVILAEDESRIVGCLMYYDSDHFAPSEEMKQFLPEDRYNWLNQYYEIGVPKSLYIESLAVHEGYRSHGIGKHLIELAIEYAKKSDLDKLSLFVFEENAGGQRFYEREGFKLVNKFNLESYEFLEPTSNRVGSRLMVMDL
ncbi:MAG: GNAT family N-acetyltransferase [Pseudomonadota bacterium]